MHATAARWASASDVLDGRRPTAYRVPGARRRRLSQPGGFVHSSRRSSPLFASVGDLALTASSAPARAQAVLETPSATVEVLGLKRWTVQMLQDSLAARAPGTSLTSHACAAVLRAKLGFADAAVVHFGSGGRAKKYVAITVIEPQDLARVRYRPEFADTLPEREAWHEAAALLARDPGAFYLVLQEPAVLVARRGGSAPEPEPRTPRRRRRAGARLPGLARPRDAAGCAAPAGPPARAESG